MSQIPHILHQVWVGPKAIPEKLIRFAESWQRHHKHWEMILWTDRPEDHQGPWDSIARVPELVNQRLLGEVDGLIQGSAKWACISDLIRMDVVTTHGGVYADLDVEVFTCIDDVLEGVRLFNADEWWNRMGNFLFGAVRNHPAMWHALNCQENRFREAVQLDKADRARCTRWRPWRKPNRYARIPFSPVWLTGPIYLNQCMAGHPDLVKLPPTLFSCLDVDWKPDQVKNWPGRALGLHHFGGDHLGSWYIRKRRMPDTAYFEPEGVPHG